MGTTSYWERRLSRRRVLQSATLGGVGLAAASVVGCGEDEPRQGPVASLSGGGQTVEQPRSGGTFITCPALASPSRTITCSASPEASTVEFRVAKRYWRWTLLSLKVLMMSQPRAAGRRIARYVQRDNEGRRHWEAPVPRPSARSRFAGINHSSSASFGIRRLRGAHCCSSTSGQSRLSGNGRENGLMGHCLQWSEALMEKGREMPFWLLFNIHADVRSVVNITTWFDFIELLLRTVT